MLAWQVAEPGRVLLAALFDASLHPPGASQGARAIHPDQSCERKPVCVRPKGFALLHAVSPLRVWRAALTGPSRRMIAVRPRPDGDGPQG
jgi:hypothetical protein